MPVLLALCLFVSWRTACFLEQENNLCLFSIWCYFVFRLPYLCSSMTHYQFTYWRKFSFEPSLFDSYVLKSEKADVYRLPYLSSGAPGFGLSFTPSHLFPTFHNVTVSDILVWLSLRKELEITKQENPFFANKGNVSFTYLALFWRF